MNSSIDIDNKPDKLESFVVPVMSLSSSKSSMKRHKFTIKISVKELIELMSAEYYEWVNESKKDDKACASLQDELAEAGYPKISELLKNSLLTELVFGHYLVQELFSHIAWDGKAEIKHWFDSTTGCNINDTHVELHGICYSKN